jgi:hypothetical protein
VNKKRGLWKRTVDVPLPGDEPPTPGYWYRPAYEGEPVPDGDEYRPDLGSDFDAGYFEVDDFAPGSCRNCGCPPDQMPMVNRGTGWCSELCRKELAE